MVIAGDEHGHRWKIVTINNVSYHHVKRALFIINFIPITVFHKLMLTLVFN